MEVSAIPSAATPNESDGIDIDNVAYNIISGNTIGTDASGAAALANGGSGIYVCSDANLAGLDEDSLMLGYWNGGMWEDVACGPYERHPDENWLAVPICHLSRFALFGKGDTVYLPLVVRNY